MLPLESVLSLTIEQAAEMTGRSVSTIRNMIVSGKLSEVRGEVVNMGTGRKNSAYNITRKGMAVLSGEKIPFINYIELAKQIVKITKEEVGL